jgi:fused signal recognition particle receptor
MKSWLAALARTRDRIVQTIARVVPGVTRLDAADLEQWEAALIQADVPARLAAEWAEDLRRANRREPLREQIRGKLTAALPARPPYAWPKAGQPAVILIVGVNGSGKTTTAAKLAWNARQAGRKPLLGAADTFRAAGSGQLKIWADRLGIDAVVGATGADAAAVAFDAVQAAVSRKADVLLIDTAGRMHTKQPLMDELQKVRRSVAKALPGAPHETWIVLDATLGHNAVVQAKTFQAAVALTGAVVSKLDGSAKGGFILAIEKELGIPVRFAGLGEGEDDLAPFSAPEFIGALLGEEP